MWKPWLEADGRRYEASGNDFFPGICGRKAQCFDSEYLKPFVERGSNFKNRIGSEEPVSHEIRKGIREIYAEWQQQKEGYPLMIKANILRILTMLIRTYQDESKSGEMLKEKKSAMKRLEQAISYIDHHYSEKSPWMKWRQRLI